MIRTTYFQGGAASTSAPGNGRAEEWDSAGNTYTTWNQQGAQTSQRALSAQETADLTAAQALVTATGNGASLRAKAQQALTTNAAFLALPDPTSANNTFLALGSPSNAQVLAQVQALTRQMTGTTGNGNKALYDQAVAITKENNAVIRLLLGQLDDTAGT